jgi:hypothetical protein
VAQIDLVLEKISCASALIFKSPQQHAEVYRHVLEHRSTPKSNYRLLTTGLRCTREGSYMQFVQSKPTHQNGSNFCHQLYFGWCYLPIMHLLNTNSTLPSEGVNNAKNLESKYSMRLQHISCLLEGTQRHKYPSET